MPIEPPNKQLFEVASGYAELGMFHEANEQLETIDPFLRAAPEIAKRLTEFEPDNPEWPVQLAYATRRATSIEAAKEILLNAESKFPKEAIISYNLACYECQLRELKKAKNYLKKAFEIDLNWRKAALEDEDLKPLWNAI